MSASIKESKQLEAKSLKFKIICSEISKILYIYRKFAYFLKITVRLLNHPELLYVYCKKPKILYINYSVGTLSMYLRAVPLSFAPWGWAPPGVEGRGSIQKVD